MFDAPPFAGMDGSVMLGELPFEVVAVVEVGNEGDEGAEVGSGGGPLEVREPEEPPPVCASAAVVREPTDPYPVVVSVPPETIFRSRWKACTAALVSRPK